MTFLLFHYQISITYGPVSSEPTSLIVVEPKSPKFLTTVVDKKEGGRESKIELKFVDIINGLPL